MRSLIERSSHRTAGGKNREIRNLPTQLSDCLLRGMAAGVRCPASGSLVVDMANVLHLGPGPLVELSTAPGRDESVTLGVSHVTLRDAACLLACRYDELADEPGRIAIEASDCAFMPTAGSGLMIFSGDNEPSGLIRQLQWSGQGCVLALRSPLAVWTDAEGNVRAAAEDQAPPVRRGRSATGEDHRTHVGRDRRGYER